jgi:hypothetical protein
MILADHKDDHKHTGNSTPGSQGGVVIKGRSRKEKRNINKLTRQCSVHGQSRLAVVSCGALLLELYTGQCSNLSANLYKT